VECINCVDAAYLPILLNFKPRVIHFIRGFPVSQTPVWENRSPGRFHPAGAFCLSFLPSGNPEVPGPGIPVILFHHFAGSGVSVLPGRSFHSFAHFLNCDDGLLVAPSFVYDSVPSAAHVYFHL